jgi:hypothetical protein
MESMTPYRETLTCIANVYSIVSQQASSEEKRSGKTRKDGVFRRGLRRLENIALRVKYYVAETERQLR